MSHGFCYSFFTICCDHAFILCYHCNMLSGIVLAIACPETIHRPGCFDRHIFIIYLVGCVLLTSWHEAPIRSYFVQKEDKVTTLQSGYGVFVLKLWRDFALSIVSTNRWQWKHIVALSCHSDFFADFEQMWDHYNSYFYLLSLNIHMLRGGYL